MLRSVCNSFMIWFKTYDNVNADPTMSLCCIGPSMSSQSQGLPEHRYNVNTDIRIQTGPFGVVPRLVLLEHASVCFPLK